MHEETSDLWFPPSFCLLLIAAGQTNIAATADLDVQRWPSATGIRQRMLAPLPLGEGWGEGAQLGKAHVFDETFGVNSAFNAEVFVAAPHAVAMEFDLLGERRSGHWVGGVSKRKLLVA